MSRLSQDKINLIRNSVDIVDVIGGYLPLTKKGKGYWAVCPFHDDKNPSLSISRELQIYRCFVCDAKGNVFTFLQNYLKISFLEAVKLCADMAGIDVSEIEDHKSERPIDEEKKALYSLNKEACNIYQLFLKSAIAKGARAYLNERRMGNDVIEAFEIGFSPDDTSLTKAFTAMNFSYEQMVTSGLVLEGNQHYYDRFKNRIMFPLWDSEGRVVGFSGRIYERNDTNAKYLNSPETPIFTKGDCLYHYHKAKNPIKQQGFVYILEGFMDVIAMYKAGYENTVALMGTALTKQHLLMLRKLTDTVYLCLDGDAPGQQATKKAIDALLTQKFNIRVITLKQNMDPDELLSHFGKDALDQALNSHQSYLEFLIHFFYQHNNMRNYEDRKEYIHQLLPYLKHLEDVMDIDYYTSMIQQLSGFSAEMIKQQIQAMQGDEKRRASASIPNTQAPKKEAEDVGLKLEKSLLHFMMYDKEVSYKYEHALGVMYHSMTLRLANQMIAYYRQTSDFDLASFLDFLTTNHLNQEDIGIIYDLACEVAMMKLPRKTDPSTIDEYIKKIKDQIKKQQKQELLLRLKNEPDPHQRDLIVEELCKYNQET